MRTGLFGHAEWLKTLRPRSAGRHKAGVRSDRGAACLVRHLLRALCCHDTAALLLLISANQEAAKTCPVVPAAGYFLVLPRQANSPARFDIEARLRRIRR